ncbi:tape measure domain-containing protein [Dokdonella fugitiva]|uniref:Tape measure domain-containing protein n=1 Tax=Dokdonella fugitiva TaxID=328517 RepID=A0A839EYP6_9GAMM|nr:tape measure protein [Dokdonella fugitiva]MBA8888905.1 tape measure domain-containing protein [Dokdonella fugitiva]
MANDFKQVLEIAFQVLGQEQAQQLADALDKVGDAGSTADSKLTPLVAELETLGDTSAKVALALDLSKRIEANNQALAEAKAQLADLNREFSRTDKSSADVRVAFEQAERRVRTLGAEELRLQTASANVATTLRSLGIDTNNLAGAQDNLKARMSGVAEKVKQTAQAIQGSGEAARKATAEQAGYGDQIADTARKVAAIGAAALGVTSAIGLAKQGLADLIRTAGEFQKLDVQLDSLFGQGSDAALASIQQFAKDTPFQLQQVSEAFVKLKAFGIDPLDGTFQAIADEASTLGGSTETLTGIVLGLGQAWAKQKLQGEEILQLVERGVPVWELLSRATGKNVTELQALSQAGKLGRAEIALLIQEIGKSSEGASAKLANTLPGQINKLQSEWASFLNLIANSGALEFLQQQLARLLDQVKALSESGDLQRYAKSISESLVQVATVVGRTLGFLIDHKEAIAALALAYQGFKAYTFLQQMDAVQKVGETLTGNFTKLSGATKGFGAALLAIQAVDAVQNLLELNRALEESAGVQLALAQAERERAEAQANAAAKAAQVRQELARYADTVVLAHSSVELLGAAERTRYGESLQAAQRYYTAVNVQAKQAGDTQAAAFASERVKAYGAAIEELRQAEDALAQAAATAHDNLALKATDQAMAKLFELRDAGKGTAEAIEGAFETLNLQAKQAPAALAGILANVRVEGESTARVFDTQLVAALGKLEGASLGQFQSNVVTALRDGKTNAADLTHLLDASLQAALGKLGVSAVQAGVKITASGAEMIDTFRVVASNAQATGQQIEAAFEAALASAKTEAEAKALGDVLKEALDAGLIGARAVDDEMAKLQDRIRSLKAEADPLADSFAALGIKSQASLNAAAAAARTAFEAIARGARDGTAAQADAVRAFKAYADAARAAAADSGAEAKARVEQQLEVQASALGLRDVLVELGAIGKAAGDKTADAFQGAKDTIDNTADAAQRAGDAARAAADGQDTYTTALTNTRDAATGVVAVTSDMHAALGTLTELLSRDANLTTISLQQAQDLLQRLGPLAGDAAQLLTQRISDLEEAARRAEETSQRMKEEADSLQDQIDQLQGNDESIEDRRHAKKLVDLKAEAEANGTANTAEYRHLVDLENQLHSLKQQNLRKQRDDERAQAEERKKAEDDRSVTPAPTAEPKDQTPTPRQPTPAPAPAPSGKQTIEIVLNGSVLAALKSATPAEIDSFMNRVLMPSFLREIRRAAAATGLGGSLR